MKYTYLQTQSGKEKLVASVSSRRAYYAIDAGALKLIFIQTSPVKGTETGVAYDLVYQFPAGNKFVNYNYEGALDMVLKADKVAAYLSTFAR